MKTTQTIKEAHDSLLKTVRENGDTLEHLTNLLQRAVRQGIYIGTRQISEMPLPNSVRTQPRRRYYVAALRAAWSRISRTGANFNISKHEFEL